MFESSFLLFKIGLDKHDGAIHRFELSCNEPSYCADFEEQIKNQLQELEIRKMEVSPILVL